MKQLLLVLLLLPLGIIAQEKATISGYLTDAQNGEYLIGAKVYIPSISAGALTNNYGFYSLTIPIGTYQIQFRATGLETVVKTVEVLKDTQINIEIGSSIGTRH